MGGPRCRPQGPLRPPPAPARGRKDTLQVVGALGGHRVCGFAGGRHSHAQRLLQHPQGRGGHPRLSSHRRVPRSNFEGACRGPHAALARAWPFLAPPTRPALSVGTPFSASPVTTATPLPSYPERSDAAPWSGRDEMRGTVWLALRTFSHLVFLSFDPNVSSSLYFSSLNSLSLVLTCPSSISLWVLDVCAAPVVPKEKSRKKKGRFSVPRGGREGSKS